MQHLAESTDPIVLFDAERDSRRLQYGDPWLYKPRLVVGSQPGESALRIGVPSFNAWMVAGVACRHVWEARRSAPGRDLSRFDTLQLRVRARVAGTKRFEFALADDCGVAWGESVSLTADWQDIRIRLPDLRPVNTILVPWGFPRFEPYSREPGRSAAGLTASIRADTITAMQFAFGPPLFKEQTEGAHAIELESVVLETSASD